MKQPEPSRQSLTESGELMTVREVLSWLRISRSTFYRAIRAGELPAFKFGGSWRVDRKDVEEMIAARKEAAAAPPPEMSAGGD